MGHQVEVFLSQVRQPRRQAAVWQPRTEVRAVRLLARGRWGSTRAHPAGHCRPPAAVCICEQTPPTWARNTWDHADEVPFKNPMEDAVKVAIESGGAEAGVKTIDASVKVAAEAA